MAAASGGRDNRPCRASGGSAPSARRRRCRDPRAGSRVAPGGSSLCPSPHGGADVAHEKLRLPGVEHARVRTHRWPPVQTQDPI